MNVGYVNFSKDDFGYGLAYTLSKAKINASPATVQTARHFDVILFSIFWWEHVYKFYEFCIKAGIGNEKEKPLVIVGGFNTFNPWVFVPYAHRVFMGDGEENINQIIQGEITENTFTGTEKSVNYKVCAIADNDYVYDNGKGISRIEIARGCKYKCKFCQLTWLKPYREVNYETITRAIDKVTSNRVALFAPNGPSHSKYKAIAEYSKSKGFPNIAADVRYNELEGYDNQQTPTIGLEGLSYRLRKSIGKPVTNQEFRDKLFDLFERQLKKGYRPSVHTYIILDLPGETAADFEEYRNLMMMVDEYKYSPMLTWIMSGNVFMPAPHTPLENAEIHIDRDYKMIWGDGVLSDRGDRPKHKFQLGGRHTVFSPYSRLLSMIATRGGPEACYIIEQIVGNKLLKHSMIGQWQKALEVLTKFIDRYFGGIEKYYTSNPEKHWEVVKMQKMGEAKKPLPSDKLDVVVSTGNILG